MHIRFLCLVTVFAFAPASLVFAPLKAHASTKVLPASVPRYGQTNTLTWVNPPLSDIKSLTLVRGDSIVPTSVTDGVVIYSGTDTRYIDIVPDGSQYKYALFAVRIDGSDTRIPFTLAVGAYAEPVPVVTYNIAPLSTWVPTTYGGANVATLPKTLSLGVTSKDVLVLQRMLNVLGCSIAPSGVGSIGHETNYFGKGTQVALRRFQCENMRLCSGSPTLNGYGLAGRATRAKLIAVFMASGKTIPTGEMK